mmetsp:Transcript_7990/g.22957  ORF Transcript_7990/g.22957 Transcript_7990/m.22957 type:complete len:279 (-) Transcript_7990:2605-3441(-)
MDEDFQYRRLEQGNVAQITAALIVRGTIGWFLQHVVIQVASQLGKSRIPHDLFPFSPAASGGRVDRHRLIFDSQHLGAAADVLQNNSQFHNGQRGKLAPAGHGLRCWLLEDTSQRLAVASFNRERPASSSAGNHGLAKELPSLMLKVRHHRGLCHPLVHGLIERPCRCHVFTCIIQSFRPFTDVFEAEPPHRQVQPHAFIVEYSQSLPLSGYRVASRQRNRIQQLGNITEYYRLVFPSYVGDFNVGNFIRNVRGVIANLLFLLLCLLSLFFFNFGSFQ